jgi:hypothetical protein
LLFCLLLEYPKGSISDVLNVRVIKYRDQVCV